MKIKTYFTKSKSDLESKIVELNYLKDFYTLVEKFNTMKCLKFEVYKSYNKVFAAGDEKQDIISKFDILPPDFESYMITQIKTRSIKYPFFGSKDSKLMTSFLIYLSDYGYKIWPYYEFEGARIFLLSEIFNWRGLRPFNSTYNQSMLLDSLPKLNFPTELTNKIIDFCSNCREKGQVQFLSEYNYYYDTARKRRNYH